MRYVSGIGMKRLDIFSKCLRVNGFTARVHGNIHRKPKHALSFSSTEYVVRFLLTYSEEHSLLLPGRIPGYEQSDIQLLPSSTTKRVVWRVYRSAAEAVSKIHVVHLLLSLEDAGTIHSHFKASIESLLAMLAK